jgi:hypothetical protein
VASTIASNLGGRDNYAFLAQMCDAEVYEPRQEAGALSIASNSSGPLFFGPLTRPSTGHMRSVPTGDGRSSGSPASAPSHAGQSAGSRITGTQSCGWAFLLSIPVVMPPIVIVMPPAMPPTVADPIDRLDCPLIRNRAVFRLINQQRVTDCCGGRRFGWNPAQQRKHHQRRNQRPYHGIFSIRS